MPQLTSSLKIQNIYTKKMLFKEQKIMRSAGVQVKGSVGVNVTTSSRVHVTRSVGVQVRRN